MVTLKSISVLKRATTWPLTGQLPTKIRLSDVSAGYISDDMPFMNNSQEYLSVKVKTKNNLILATGLFKGLLDLLDHDMTLSFIVKKHSNLCFLNTNLYSSPIEALTYNQSLSLYSTSHKHVLYISNDTIYNSEAITSLSGLSTLITYNSNHNTLCIKQVQVYTSSIQQLNANQSINLGIKSLDTIVTDKSKCEIKEYSFAQVLNFYTGNALLEVKAIYNVIRNKFPSYFNTNYSVLIGPNLVILYDVNMTCLAVFHVGYNIISKDTSKYKDSNGDYLQPDDIESAIAGFDFAVFDTKTSKLDQFNFSSLNFTSKDIYYLDNNNSNSNALSLTSVGSTIYVVPSTAKGNALLDNNSWGYICQINDIKLLPNTTSYLDAKSKYLSDVLYPVPYIVERYLGVNSDSNYIVQCKEIASNNKHIVALDLEQKLARSLFQYNGSDILLIDNSDLYFAENDVEFHASSDFNYLKKFNYNLLQLTRVKSINIVYNNLFKTIRVIRAKNIWILHQDLDLAWYLQTIDNSFSCNLTDILGTQANIIDYCITSDKAHYFITDDRLVYKFNPYLLNIEICTLKGTPIKLIPMR